MLTDWISLTVTWCGAEVLAARPPAPGTGLQLAGGPPAVARPRAQHALQVTLAVRGYVPGAV